MNLSLKSKPKIYRKKCSNCKSRFLLLNHNILKDRELHAIALSECHVHEGVPEIYFTITLETWDNSTEDHVTFSCRYGEVSSGEGLACTVTDTPEVYKQPYAGKLLSRDEALGHPKLKDFWKVVDFLLESERTFHNHMHHRGTSRFKLW